jgi:hypothetical protein
MASTAGTLLLLSHKGSPPAFIITVGPFGRSRAELLFTFDSVSRFLSSTPTSHTF